MAGLHRPTQALRQRMPSVGTERSELSAACADARAPQRRDHLGVSRERAISDDGPVFTRELDRGLLQHGAAAADATRAPRPARAQVPSGRGPGCVRLWGGASFADVNMVAS